LIYKNILYLLYKFKGGFILKDKLSTNLTHLGEKGKESVSSSKSPSITMSSAFVFDDVESLDKVYEKEAEGFIYSRNGNPNHEYLKEIMTSAESGEYSCVFSSGMAAITLSILSVVSSGDHIIASNVLYGGTFTFLKEELKRFNIEVSFTDITKDFNADIVINSATKYICGHSDVTGGIVTSNKIFGEKIEGLGVLYGPMMSPSDAWLLTRSLRTLDLRVKEHSRNALELSRYLSTEEKVLNVYYPGLESSESYNLASKIFENAIYGGMLSFDLKGGEKSAYELIRNLKKVKLVPSLAGVTTTLSYPAKTSHRGLNEEELKKANISKGLLRLSAGLDDVEDIIKDFELAFSKL
jgi:methionine-gamma-lyase